MSNLSSVLNQAQKDSLEIVNFIFHIIDPDAASNDKVIELDEVTLQAKQKRFFLDRLKEIAEGSQYEFHKDTIDLKNKCLSMIQTPTDFVKLSRQLTHDFSGRHKGSMSAGIFVVCQVKYLFAKSNWQELIFLVKMDKQQSFSYSYEEKGGKKIAKITENPNALNESKSAVQKSALVDVSDNFKWDVLAFDKSGKASSLTDYFQAFLGVIERDTPSNLTRRANAAVRTWADKLDAADLPPEENPNTYKSRAVNYLTDHDAFDTDEFINAVVRDSNTERKKRLSKSLRSVLDEVGVSGQTFEPSPGSLKPKEKSVSYKTKEGVIITFEGDEEAAGIQREKLAGNKWKITIETDDLTTG